MEQSSHYLFECDQPHCHRRLTFATVEEVEYERINHKCPYWGGDSKVGWSVTRTLVEEMWDMLDETMIHLMEDKDSPETWKRETKARARAFAECLAIFMRPFFDTADDIAKEAVKRYRAKQEGDAEYETAGLGNRRYETAAQQHLSATPGWYGTAQDGYTSDPTRAGSPSVNRGRGASTRAATAIARGMAVITEKDQSAMKMAYEGMPQIFTPTVLAKQYGYPEPAVRKLLGLTD